MSTNQPPVDHAATAANLVAMSDEDRAAAFKNLSGKAKKKVGPEMERIYAAQKDQAAAGPSTEHAQPGGEDSDEDDGVVMPTPGTTAPPTAPPTTAPAIVQKKPETISDAEVQEMWAEIDKFDITQISPEDLRIFEYEGFNPDEILRAMISQQKINNIPKAEFLRDVAVLCGLAIVKGTVNDNNLKKMQKAGQDVFHKLSARYGIKKGSAKGQSSDVVTVSRIAAAFPGTVVRLLHEQKVQGRDFVGPLKSSKMPSAIRHQALAACIPREADDDLKGFLLAAITAFSVDQSLIISKPKPKLDVAIPNQTNFIRVAHEGRYPRESVRKAIFKGISWEGMWEPISICVKELAKHDETVKPIDLPTFRTSLNKL